MKNRMEEIKKKGFAMGPADRQEQVDYENPNVDFSKIRVGVKTLEDAVVENIGSYHRVDARLANRENVLRAMRDRDYFLMREISDFFYRTSGIYNRLVRYMAYLYRYDWLMTPYVIENKEKVKPEKVLETFYKALNYLDNFEVKKFFGEVALKVIKDGDIYKTGLYVKDRIIGIGSLSLKEIKDNKEKIKLLPFKI